jgi:hypothetical protein
MINSAEVFDAVRRGYVEFESASNEEIVSYFDGIDDESVGGHANNIKGILFEQEYADNLLAQGIDAELFSETNHPITDLAIWDDGELVNELQLKATDSISYIQATISDNPDITIVATSEVASNFDSETVIDAGIENVALEDAVSETLFDEAINPLSKTSILGWIFGLPF